MCAQTVYQVIFSSHAQEPGKEARNGKKKKLESAKVLQRRQRCVDLNEVFVCVQYVQHIAKRNSCKW